MMGQQMELFGDGGLKDEGGTKDPVSGNDVPSGSLQEEVRDDIPAMLSEGEFVFPADVVRYYGLETLMKMRQEAKQGLKMMEAMGQMGNSEEATIPDDVPFNVDDLEIEDDGLEFNIGGVVSTPSQFANVSTQPRISPQNPIVQPPVIQPPVVVNPPPRIPNRDDEMVAFPTNQPTLTFDNLIPKAGVPGQSVPMEFVNKEGQTVVIPSVNGKPLYPPPAGFTAKAPKDMIDDGKFPVMDTSLLSNQTSDVSDSQRPSSATTSRDVMMPTIMDRPKSPTAYQADDYRDYLARRSKAGSMGVNYAAGDMSPSDAPITSSLAQNMITQSGKTFPLDQSSGIAGKAGDIIDTGASMILGGSLTGDTAIRANAAKRLNEGRYANSAEYNLLRNTIDLTPQKTLFNRKGVDDPDLAKEIAQAKTVKFDSATATVQANKDRDFQEKLREEEAKNPRSSVEMTRMMITQDPRRESAIMMGESNSAREERERREADEMRRAADMDAFRARENERRAEQNMNVNNDNDSSNDTSGSDYSEPTAGGGGGGDSTHCCTASYKRKGMTISQVKELRRWHRKQSQIWQDGYDVWGKYIADTFVAKSDWSASVVKSVYELIIKKKLTPKGLYGMILISLGVYPIGLFKRIIGHGRTFQSN